MEERACKDCCHFRQHYIKKDSGNGESRFIPINDGHCVNPRLKIRNRETPACKFYNKLREKEKKKEE